jgi:ATP-dependent Clp protease ATP-binding subunit ClpA
MFERFTNNARRAIVLAQEEARDLQHNYIGTEHLLLGLAAEPRGLAGRALDDLGLSRARIREDILAAVGGGDGAAVPSRIPFTPRAKKVLELSLREALQLNHNYIGTEHLLLGLVREGSGVAAVILADRAGSLDAVRTAVVAKLPAAAPVPLDVESLGRVSQLAARLRSADGEPQPLRTTPAADSELNEATRLAGTQPLGTHHLVLAALADPGSAAARALAALGLDLDQARAALRQADVTGSSDELPEEAGRRQMLIRVTGDTLTIEVTDPDIVARGRVAIDALGEDAGEPPAIRGDRPGSASLAAVWLALRTSLDDIHRAALAADEKAPPPPRRSAPGPDAA